jgi:hypothetical protein
MRRREMENVAPILHCISTHLKCNHCSGDNWKRQKDEMYAPIKLDVEASDSKLETVKIFERVECQAPDGRGACKRSEELR